MRSSGVLQRVHLYTTWDGIRAALVVEVEDVLVDVVELDVVEVDVVEVDVVDVVVLVIDVEVELVEDDVTL